jgi:hypothetical protein
VAVVAGGEAAGLPDNSLAAAAGRTTAKHATTRIHRRILAPEVMSMAFLPACAKPRNRVNSLGLGHEW